jgi:putative glutamine amidotransferase
LHIRSRTENVSANLLEEEVLEMYPIIGIPCRAGVRGKTNRPMYYSNKSYVQAIEHAGGVPMLIPIMKEPEILATLLSHVDGLLLPGGIDIHPSNYQEEVHPALRETDIQLDELELELVSWAMQQDVPTLGICRGLQMMNVALGGTLYQDLTTEYTETTYSENLQHANWDLPVDEIVHSVQIESESFIKEVLGVREVAVNSLHHQAIKAPGKGVCISGRSEDNVVESIEVPGQNFMIAVQCHPEELYMEQPVWSRLFRAFIDACVWKK